MPFKSRMQIKKFAEMVKQGTMSKQEFHKWLNETPDPSDLPDRVTDRPESKKKDGWKDLKT